MNNDEVVEYSGEEVPKIKVQVKIEIEIEDESLSEHKREAIRWIRKQITKKDNLILYSKEIDDEIGMEVKVLECNIVS